MKIPDKSYIKKLLNSVRSNLFSHEMTTSMGPKWQNFTLQKIAEFSKMKLAQPQDLSTWILQGCILPPCPLGHGQGGFFVQKKN